MPAMTALMQQKKTEQHLYLWAMELPILQKYAYSQMQTQMKDLGYDNVFIGTVEGEPEETSHANL